MKGMEENFLKMMGGLGSPLEQGTLLFAAVFLLGFGALLLATWMMRREKTATREGRSVGLRDADGYYFIVYEYRDDDGQLLQATSEQSTRSLAACQPGSMAQIHVPEARPDIAAASPRGVAPAAGALLVACGLFAAFKALTDYPVNGFTLATGIVVLVFFFKKFGRRMPTPAMHRAFAEWRTRNRDALVSLPLQQPDSLEETASPGARDAVFPGQEKALRVMGPVYMLAGAGAIAGALYFSGGMIDLAVAGTSTRGIVTEIAKEGGARVNVVHFRDKQGNAVRFEDRPRFDLPSHEEGDEVGVLYMEKDPAGTAAVDYGWRAWLVPGLLACFGIFTLLSGVAAMPRQRDEVR